MTRTKQTARKTNMGPMKTLRMPTKHPPASGGVVKGGPPRMKLNKPKSPGTAPRRTASAPTKHPPASGGVVAEPQRA